jgi:TRAP-type C4-dicarboxylate transport system substrate-binding protein
VKKLFFVFLAVILVLGLILAGCASSTPAPTTTTPQTTAAPTTSAAPKTTAPATSAAPSTTAAKPGSPITLNFVTFIATNNPEYSQLFKPVFIDKMNEKLKGEVVIRVLGGPEIMAPNDILSAVKNGTVDMSNVPTSFYGSQVPGSDCTRMSEIIERDNPEVFKYIQSLYEKENLFYLGKSKSQGELFLYIFMKKPITSLADLKGLRISGASSSYNAFYQSMGMTPINIPLGEYYAANERGVSDGGASSIYIWSGTGLAAITPYLIDHPWSLQPSVHIINMNKWKQIPEHLQKLLIEAQIEGENAWYKQHAIMAANIKKAEVAKGAKMVKLPEADAAAYLKNFYETGWKFDYERYPKDIVAKMESMIRKTK